MACSVDKREHVVILPFAQQGHINPLMQLAKKLAHRGARVTFVVPEHTVPSKEKAGSTPNLEVVGVADGLPPERSRGSSFRDSVDSMEGIQAGFCDLLSRLSREPTGVSALIYDTFMAWAPAIASSLSLPFICFFTSNAVSGCLFYQFPHLRDRGILPFRHEGDEPGPLPKRFIEDIDGVPAILPEEFPMCATFDPTHFRYRFVMNIAEKMQGATAIIINTMEELEPEALAALRTHKSVYTVGPLLLLSGRPARLDVNYWQEQDHCLPWLDSHPPSTVLYVSFGSVASLPLPQFQQFAMGLEASGHPFLWVVREDAVETSLEDALPDGFLARTKDHGLIISWAPQLLVLAHPSVGGFFTHCGWNSIVENLSMGSVPMICWPHVAEQFLNRRMIVEHWKIGLRMHHEPDESVTKEEITRVVRELLEGERGKELKIAASKVGDLAKRAVDTEGSSQRSFEALFNDLVVLKNTSK